MIDLNENICTITWTVEDIIGIFEDLDRDYDEETIRYLLDDLDDVCLKETLYDRCVEEGMDLLETTVSMYC